MTKKLLIVTTVAQMLEAFLLPYAHYFREQGWQVDGMAAGINKSTLCKQYFNQCWEVPLSRNPLAPANLISVPKIIRRITAEQGYDIVHVHSPIAAFVIRYALRKRLIPKHPKVIYTAHGFHFIESGKLISNLLYLSMEKIAACWTDQLIVINQEDYIAAQKWQLATPERLHYLPGIGVDLDYYNIKQVSEYDKFALQKELGLSKQTHIFLMIAEFTQQKRHKLAIAALKLLDNPNIHLVCAGTGAYLQKVKDYVERLQVTERVHFLGFRQDIPKLLYSCTALLLVSKREGLPRCILEAMSMGKPIIGTNIRGIRDLLKAGAGLLLADDKPHTLAQAMQTMIFDPLQLEKMSAAGLTQVQSYKLSAIIEHHVRIYQAALQKR